MSFAHRRPPLPLGSETTILATRRLRRLLVPEAEPAARLGTAAPLAVWCATAVPLDGGHAVLFVERGTLLEVVVPAGDPEKVEKAFARRAVALLGRLEAGRESVRRAAARLERIRWRGTRAETAEDRILLSTTAAAAHRLREQVGELAPGFGETATRFELAEASRPRAALAGRTPRQALL